MLLTQGGVTDTTQSPGEVNSVNFLIHLTNRKAKYGPANFCTILSMKSPSPFKFTGCLN